MAVIRLYDLASGAPIGAVSEQQLQTLVDQLEEEGRHDQDYYIDRSTLEMLESRGADAALTALLRGALGDRDDMDIRWEKEG